jgi:AcrR family transcriptional regulator
MAIFGVYALDFFLTFRLTGQYNSNMQRKEAILDAAIGLFSKKPYHMVGMDDIAKKANVAKGTLYYHFRSKEDLYVAMLQDGIERLLYKLKIDSKGDVLDDLKLFIERLVYFFVEKKEFYEVLKREEGKILSRRLKNCYEKTCSIRELLQSILRKGFNESIFKKDLEIEVTAEIILGMIKSVVNLNINAQILSNMIFDLLTTGIIKK